MNKRILIILSSVITLMSFTSCEVDSKDVIDQKYSVEAVNLTKNTAVTGVDFYVPDEHLNSDDKEIVSNDNEYYLKDKSFIMKVKRISDLPDSDDTAVLSSFFSQQFSENITVQKEISEDKMKCTAKIDEEEKYGYIKTVNDEYAIICVCKDENTAETIADSLKESKTKRKSTAKTEVINVDSDIAAYVNGVEVGSAVSLKDIQNDFSQMGANFDKMKDELSDINGSSIEDINHKVVMQFNAVDSAGREVQQAYLTSVTAYRSAVDQYNVALSNGIDLNSTKEEIRKALNVDLSPEWGKIVINNQSKTSGIRQIIIEYNNEKDGIEAIIINDTEQVKDEVAGREAVRDEARKSVEQEPIEIPEGTFGDSPENEVSPELGLQGISK